MKKKVTNMKPVQKGSSPFGGKKPMMAKKVTKGKRTY